MNITCISPITELDIFIEFPHSQTYFTPGVISQSYVCLYEIVVFCPYVAFSIVTLSGASGNENVVPTNANIATPVIEIKKCMS